MHPVDQYEAFDAHAKQGKDIADIAAQFGTTETIVRKRLALARVSPVLLQQFRAEDMSFAQLSAFTVSDDHERQVAVWNSLTSWNRDQDPRGTVASFSAISTTVTAYIEAAIDGIVGPVSSSMAIPRPASEV